MQYQILNHTLLSTLLFTALTANASDYTTLLDASSFSVGATLGENLIVKEGCMIPGEELATCAKAKYISAVSGRIGSIERDVNLADGFEVSMGIDVNNPSGGGSGGESLILKASDGSELIFSYRKYSHDCRSTNPLDSGGSDAIFSLTNFLDGDSVENFSIGVDSGVAECYCNNVSTLYGTQPVRISLSDSARLFTTVLIAGINDNDRLFDVKYRGQKLYSCGDSCVPVTPQPGSSIVISATNGPQLSVKGGYIKLDITAGIAPDPNDCSTLEHDGRMVLDNVAGTLYLCTQSGWVANQ